MFHVLTTYISLDYEINNKSESDFVIRDFFVPTNCVLPSHPNNHETSTGFCKSFPLTGCNQSLNHGKIYSQNILEGSVMSSQVVCCSIIPTHHVFSAIMFHVLTTYISLDYEINNRSESDFVIRDFFVPTNCVLPGHPNNHETSTGFCKSFALTGCNQSLNHGKIYSQNILEGSVMSSQVVCCLIIPTHHVFFSHNVLCPHNLYIT